jgi:two-component system, cell cycle sensor histidine kinase and response regulator CckA
MDAVELMAGGIAHRFNNLLTSIQGNACNVLDSLDDEDLKAQLQETVDACREAADFTAHLLAISGRHWAQPRVVDLRQILAEANPGRLVSGKVAFCTNLSTSPCRVRVDPSHVETVVTNLIENAFEAVGERGVIELSVDHLAVRNIDGVMGPGWVQVEVADNGPGMDPDTLSRAFDPFFTTRDGAGRSGLGLPIAYGLVRRMKGSMALESRPGRGTQARFWIPAVDDSSDGPELVG